MEIDIVIAYILKYGIPSYVLDWDIWLPVKKPKTKKQLHQYLNELVSGYHHHSFIRSDYLFDDNESETSGPERRPPDVYTIHNKVGVIKYYQYFGTEAQSKATVNKVRKAINFWKDLKGIIIDLTEHEGGSVQPFIHSLVDVLGNTTLLAFGPKAISFKEPRWSNLINGNLIIGNFMTSELRYQKPIAVIVSKNTASSGEIAAALFKGRTNAKLFGETTSGHLSVNNVYNFEDFDLVLTTSLITTVDGIFQDTEKLHVKKSRNAFKDALEWINR